jgi:hypothetical protein
MQENIIYREYYTFDDSFYATDEYYNYENGYYIHYKDKKRLYPKQDDVIILDIVLPLYNRSITYQDVIQKMVYNNIEIETEMLEDIYWNEMFMQKWNIPYDIEKRREKQNKPKKYLFRVVFEKKENNLVNNNLNNSYVFVS